jgi:hypothetical protein
VVLSLSAESHSASTSIGAAMRVHSSSEGSMKEVEARLSGFLVPRAGKNGQAWIFLKLGIDESQLTEKKD